MKGTDKQIRWAEEIKAATLKKVDGYRAPSTDTERAVLDLVRTALETKDDASWWIKYRNPLSRDLDFIATYTLGLQPQIDAILKG